MVCTSKKWVGNELLPVAALAYDDRIRDFCRLNHFVRFFALSAREYVAVSALSSYRS